MWRSALITLGALVLMTGCARSEPPAPATVHHGPASAALVFTPPVAYEQPPVDLWRDQRQAQAFLGFDQPTTSYYRLRQDDQQRHGRFGSTDRFERRAVIVQSGVRTR